MGLFRNGKLNVFPMYFHRYLRLTPVLAACILTYMSIVRFMSSGPLWPQRFSFIEGSCTQYWWSPLIYVQNYVNPNKRVSVYNSIGMFPMNFGIFHHQIRHQLCMVSLYCIRKHIAWLRVVWTFFKIVISMSYRKKIKKLHATVWFYFKFWSEVEKRW